MTSTASAATHSDALKRLYQAWLSGDAAALDKECPEKLTFEIKGKSALAAKHDRAGFMKLMGRMKEMTGGTFACEMHDVLASDRHGMVLSTIKLTREGKPSEYRSVHVWRFENGQPIAGYEYLRDQYQFDQVWA